MRVSFPKRQQHAKPRAKKEIRDPISATLAMVLSVEKSDCVSQDTASLSEPTVGPTDVRLSILKKIGKRSPRAHLKI